MQFTQFFDTSFNAGNTTIFWEVPLVCRFKDFSGFKTEVNLWDRQLRDLGAVYMGSGTYNKKGDGTIHRMVSIQ